MVFPAGVFSGANQVMLRLTKVVWVILVVTVLVATGVMLRTSVAQKASVPKPQNNLALGEEHVRQLLLLMDKDNDGKVSKQEYMSFMEAEFERLDKKKSEDLDVTELVRTSLITSHPTHSYTGK